MQSTYSLCDATINLSRPTRSYKSEIKSFGGKRRTGFVYVCPKCANERKVLASAFRGKTPVPSVGAIVCGAYIPGGAK